MEHVNRILWVDTETTGTDPTKHGILQIAAIVEVNGKVTDKIDIKMQPVKGKLINGKALEVHGYNLDTIKTFQEPQLAFNTFYGFLHKNNPVKSRTTRYIMGGKNLKFDLDFINQWFKDITGGPYAFWDYLQFKGFDVSHTLDAMMFAGILPVNDTKLGTVCAHYGIDIKAHDAMSDIEATRELTHLIYGKFFSQFMGKPWGLHGALEGSF